MKNYFDSEEYKSHLQEFDYVFCEDYYIDSKSIKLSEKLTLNIDYYCHLDDERGRSIGCQNVELINELNEVIFSNKAVYGSLFYQYIQHSNGNEYFVTGSSIYEYVLFNITKNTSQKFVGEWIVNPTNHIAYYWYLDNWLYNPRNNLIAINGQDILNCGRVTICEFLNDKSFPFMFHKIQSLIFEYDEAEGHFAKNWTDTNSLEVEVVEGYSKTILLTEKEIKEFIKGS